MRIPASDGGRLSEDSKVGGMSPDVEQPAPPDVGPARTPALSPRQDPQPYPADPDARSPAAGPRSDDAPGGRRRDRVPGKVHGSHHLLRDTPADRWRWRAKIRQSRSSLRIYRVGVAVVGTVLVVLGFLSGPLPGPGGIPLVLLGLAVMASEFVWAERLMVFFKIQLRRFQSWSRARQTAAFAVFFACCGLLGYVSLLTFGPPAWLPGPVDGVLARLPGL